MVYCKECKYLETTKNVNRGIERFPPCQCTHPENIEEITSQAWYSETKEANYRQHPEVINVSNECECFEQKEKIAQFGDTV